MQDEDSPTCPGRVTPEPNNGRARLGVNSRAHPEMGEAFWTCPYVDALPLAMNVFKVGYWDVLKLSLVSSQRVADVMANFAFNVGVRMLAKIVQRIVAVNDDGVVGPDTIKQINSFDPNILVQLICDELEKHYRELAARPNYASYLTNWLARAERLRVS